MSERFDAFRLPPGVVAGVGPGDLVSTPAGDLVLRHPPPSAALVAATAAALRAAGRALAERPVDGIVEVVDAAAARLADPVDPLRRQAEALVPLTTGYSPAMCRLVLDRMAADWRAEPLRRLLRSELGDPAVLDGFVAAGAGRRVRTIGAGLAFHVFAGNVPGVAVTSLVRSLLVKSPALAKLASGEPVLPVLFVDAVASVDPEVGAALAVTYWPGGAEEAGEAEIRAMAAADLVVVYGGATAVESFRRRAPPGRPVVVHGPRLSVGMIAAEALRAGDEAVAALARRVALAVATFDQQGCVSPHAVWVEEPGPGSAGAFAEKVAAALEDIEADLPRGRVSAGEASAIQQERGSAELRGHQEPGVRVLAGAGTGWTVVLEPAAGFRPSCLNRFLRVHPVARLEDAIEALRPLGHQLQSVAVEAGAARREALARDLAGLGATRVTDFERLPWPPPDWHHDGREPIRELVGWVDLEG